MRLWKRSVAALLAAAVVWPGTAPAQSGQGPTPGATVETSWPESDTVLDLLRADARAAAAGKRLDRAQDWLAAPASASSPAARQAPLSETAGNARDRLDVLAIYGVGQALHADVSINGELWRYRQGRRWPQGIDDAEAEPRYSLVGIDQPCVRLRWQETRRTACLRMREAGDE
jgi:hypothetical protein